MGLQAAAEAEVEGEVGATYPACVMIVVAVAELKMPYLTTPKLVTRTARGTGWYLAAAPSS